MAKIDPAVNYERFFVPAIGAPLATDLVRRAALRPGERLLDVACGTGVVARFASREIGADGTVTGLDVDPAMLGVARSTTPPEMTIAWHRASAEEMPFPDASFDVVMCQMGLQFMPDKHAALREMWRVLAPGGRLVLNMPGPAPRIFAVMEEVLESHIGAEAARFVGVVFSLSDSAEIQNLIGGADFHDISVQDEIKSLNLPVPEEFFWQYVESTPLAATVAHLDSERRALLEREFAANAQEFVKDGGMILKVRIAVATAQK